ncbi:PAS domain-containing protein [Streptomyces sp. SCA3-4]|uniref:PAS domain-containing protein n=1 Tax=Streptomyces sichuanensis TaxID=2871810 RepID=UPI001CE2F44B|nr:PAS domain-containing protein [Streptomyces sichuanensis]MCA6095977.1 PAS domain-containing protein [Streptomyces sichuanensis]
MSGGGPDGFGEELADFRARVRELEGVRGLPPDRRLRALEAALTELRYAADVLGPRHDELARRTRAGAVAGRQEEQLLRALFQRLPLPVALLDRDGAIRRLNQGAARLLGVGAGYATGRSLTAFLQPADRPALRTQAAAVARGDGDRSIVVDLVPGDGAPGDRRQLTLVALRPPGETHHAVLTVFQAPGHGVPAPRPAAAGDGTGGDARRALSEATRETLLLDTLDEVTAALLTAGSREPAAVLEAVTRALRGTVADWAIADLVTEGGTLRRIAVAAPAAAGGDGAAAAVLAQDPASCPVVVEAAAGGVVTVRVRPEDAACFGHDEEGTALIARAAVASLVCLPVRRPAEAAVAAVLTLFRTGEPGGPGPFSMPEAGVLERVARHTGLALGPPLSPRP